MGLKDIYKHGLGASDRYGIKLTRKFVTVGAISLETLKGKSRELASKDKPSVISFKKDASDPTTIVLDDRDKADTLYGQLGDHITEYAYVAMFDPKDSAWPEPVFEAGDGLMNIPVTVHLEAPAPAKPKPKDSNLGLWLGGAALGLGILVSMKPRKKAPTI